MVADPAFRGRIRCIEQLGGRVLAELLAGLAVDYDLRADLERRLDRIIAAEPLIRAVGADRMPPLPLHLVDRP